MKIKTSHLITLLILFGFILGLNPTVDAQFYFGKNKVQYTEFDWQVMTTEHFKIYFYSEESEVAALRQGLQPSW